MPDILKISSEITNIKDQLEIPKTTPTDASISNVLQLVFGIFGLVAMLVIVIAGLQFVLSRGNPEKASKARNAIVYAAIGLVIAMMAFSIVKFVIGNTV